MVGWNWPYIAFQWITMVCGQISTARGSCDHDQLCTPQGVLTHHQHFPVGHHMSVQALLVSGSTCLQIWNVSLQTSYALRHLTLSV